MSLDIERWSRKYPRCYGCGRSRNLARVTFSGRFFVWLCDSPWCGSITGMGERLFATSDPSVYTPQQAPEPCSGGDSPTGTARPQPGRDPSQQPR